MTDKTKELVELLKNKGYLDIGGVYYGCNFENTEVKNKNDEILFYDNKNILHKGKYFSMLNGWKLTIKSVVDKTPIILNRIKDKGFLNYGGVYYNYDFSYFSYIDGMTKVKIIDNHGYEHSLLPSSLLLGNKLTILTMVDKNKYIIDQFINVHGNRYDYKDVNYTISKNKLKIKCEIHGIFEQKFHKHLNGSGCPKCVGKGINTEEFLMKLKEKGLLDEGEIYYKVDFSKYKYINCQTKGIAISEFGFSHLLTPTDLLTLTNLTIQNVIDKNKFYIFKVNKVHNNKYTYPNINYIKNSLKINITCPIHGDFIQVAGYHIEGNGCQKCCNTTKSNTEEFKNKSIKVHGIYFDYSKVDYINKDEKVIIGCPIHGEFLQEASSHLQGNGCQKCSNHGYNNLKSGYFYIYELDNNIQKGLGFGISNTLKNRHRQHLLTFKKNNTKGKLLTKFYFENGSELFKTENLIKQHKNNINFGIDGFRSECLVYSEENLQYLIDLLSEKGTLCNKTINELTY
jgi:hypothetical protein